MSCGLPIILADSLAEAAHKAVAVIARWGGIK